MIATLSTKGQTAGQTVIPKSIRDATRLKAGDTVDIGYANGLIILRKRAPLKAAKVRALVNAASNLPKQTEADEKEVTEAIRRVRTRRR